MRCAAAHHGWPILREPTHLEIALPPPRKRRDHGGAHRYWARELSKDEQADGVTTPVGTVIDCARRLPFAEALAVADSALRCGAVGASALWAAGEAVRGNGARQARRVCELADGRAANPFESALRAVLSDVRGLRLTPQLQLGGDGFKARVDLADEDLRIVAEADSYAFHGDRELFERTQGRQVELSGRDWVVLPFSFGAVTGRPGWVRDSTQAVVYVRQARGYGGR